MVLNNPHPYSSEDDSDQEPWELINDPQLGAELHLDETTETTVDVASRTPNDGDLQLNEGQENTVNEDLYQDGSKCNAEENTATGNGSMAVAEEQSAIQDKASNTCDEDTSNNGENNDDPWTPLTSEEIPRDRSDSPAHHLPLPLHQTWQFITSSLRDIDNQNQLRQRAQNNARKLNSSAQNLLSNLQTQSQRMASTLQQHCDQADIQAREATQNIKQTMSTTKDNLCRLNAEYKIHEKVAAVAAVSGAILVAAGNPRAGAGSLLVAGGAIAAGEALNAGSERGCSTFTRDYGLREGVHLD
ncbi:hypothetical protein ACHAXN_003514 [Cyclotella atomus]